LSSHRGGATTAHAAGVEMGRPGARDRTGDASRGAGLAMRRRPTDDEIARELRDHLELDAETLGSTAGDPRDAARRRFGNRASIGESVREVWHWAWLEQLEQDARHGWRALVRSPAYSVAVVITLALGVGAGAAMFSFS